MVDHIPHRCLLSFFLLFSFPLSTLFKIFFFFSTVFFPSLSFHLFSASLYFSLVFFFLSFFSSSCPTLYIALVTNSISLSLSLSFCRFIASSFFLSFVNSRQVVMNRWEVNYSSTTRILSLQYQEVATYLSLDVCWRGISARAHTHTQADSARA